MDHLINCFSLLLRKIKIYHLKGLNESLILQIFEHSFLLAIYFFSQQMIPKTLSITERQILANQFKILSKLEKDDSQLYSLKIEILEQGYRKHYDKVYDVSPTEACEEICKETVEILSMFRYIFNAIPFLSDEEIESLDFFKLRFKGFDAQSNAHYSYAKFLIEKLGKWQEHRDMYLDSNDPETIEEYRKMLNKSRYIIKSKGIDFSYDDLEKFNSLV